jgi:hypothetical protein
MAKAKVPRRVRVAKNLAEMPGLKRELTAIYRASRRTAGPHPEPAVALQLAKILAEIRSVIVDHESIERLERLEARVESGRISGPRLPAPLLQLEDRR